MPRRIPRRAERRRIEIAGLSMVFGGYFAFTYASERSYEEPGITLLLATWLAANVVALGIFMVGLGMRGLSLRDRGTRFGLRLKWLGANLVVFSFVSSLVADDSKERAIAESLFGSDALAGASDWMIFVTIPLVLAGIELLRRGWRYDQMVAARPTAAFEPAESVLYLRSFEDDGSFLVGGLRRFLFWWVLTDFEQDVTSVVRRFGPVVAVGEPGERLPYLGAVRIYFDQSEWKGEVAARMAVAKLVVMKAGTSAGLWWELEQALRLCAPERVAILVTGSPRKIGPFLEELESRVGHELSSSHRPSLWEHIWTWWLGSVITFDSRLHPHAQPILWSPLGGLSNPLMPYRRSISRAFQLALQRNGVPWPPAEPHHRIAVLLALAVPFGAHLFYLGRRREGGLSLLCSLTTILLAICMLQGVAWLSLLFSLTTIPLGYCILHGIAMALMTPEEFRQHFSVRDRAGEGTGPVHSPPSELNGDDATEIGASRARRNLLLTAGYLLTLVGGTLGVAFGIHLVSSASPTGIRVFRHTENTRPHGRAMVLIGIVVSLAWLTFVTISDFNLLDSPPEASDLAAQTPAVASLEPPTQREAPDKQEEPQRGESRHEARISSLQSVSRTRRSGGGPIRVERQMDGAQSRAVSRKVRNKCYSFGHVVPASLARRNSNVVLVNELGGGRGRKLALKITYLKAKGGGFWTGPKKMEVTGKLLNGRKVQGSFTAYRSLLKATTCASLIQVEKELARDISLWLGSPGMHDKLGYAR